MEKKVDVMFDLIQNHQQEQYNTQGTNHQEVEEHNIMSTDNFNNFCLITSDDGIIISFFLHLLLLLFMYLYRHDTALKFGINLKISFIFMF